MQCEKSELAKEARADKSEIEFGNLTGRGGGVYMEKRVSGLMIAPAVSIFMRLKRRRARA